MNVTTVNETRMKYNKPKNLKSFEIKTIPCSICGNKFRSATHHVLYCDECREESELYRFADWLGGFEYSLR